MKWSTVALAAALATSGLLGCKRAEAGAGQGANAGTDRDGTGASPQAGASTAMRDMDRGPSEHVVWRAEEIEWRDGPDSFERGARFAVLDGDPSGPGVFTFRARLPDGFVIRPHWHPNVERVTVLQGTLRLGHGETLDREAAEPLPAGTYTAMPRRMIHYAIAEGETTIQLTSVGPWEIHYVDPADDPRLRR